MHAIRMLLLVLVLAGVAQADLIFFETFDQAPFANPNRWQIWDANCNVNTDSGVGWESPASVETCTDTNTFAHVIDRPGTDGNCIRNHPDRLAINPANLPYTDIQLSLRYRLSDTSGTRITAALEINGNWINVLDESHRGEWRDFVSTPLNGRVTGVRVRLLGANGTRRVDCITITGNLDTDGDLIPDASDNCPDTVNPGQEDCDGDGAGDACVADDDGDGVNDASDSAPCNRFVCRDDDNDGCNDCSSGTYNPAGDGPDCNGDGICDTFSSDDDNDGVSDAQDSHPCDNTRCGDADNDGCEDCSSGFVDLFNDGPDCDGDGLCDAGDADDDNDGVPDAMDSHPCDDRRCQDVDLDGCDDCSSGAVDPDSDGLDTDGDGLCDSGDPDDDGDGVPDESDPFPVSATRCGDSDADGCDDCSSGSFNVFDDGVDADGDGRCDRAPFLLAGEVSLGVNSGPIMAVGVDPMGGTQPVIAVATYLGSSVDLIRATTPPALQTMQRVPTGPAPFWLATDQSDGSRVWVTTGDGIYRFRELSEGNFESSATLLYAGDDYSFVERAHFNSPLFFASSTDTAFGTNAGTLESRLGDGSGSQCNGEFQGSNSATTFTEIPGSSAGYDVTSGSLAIAINTEFDPNFLYLSVFRPDESSEFTGGCEYYEFHGWIEDWSENLPGHPRAVAILDYTRVLVALEDSAAIRLFGRYSGEDRLFPTGSDTYSIQTADINVDGLADVVATQDQGATLHLLQGLGGSDFDPYGPLQLPPGSLPARPAILDANGDQRPDLVIPLFATGAVQLWLNNVAGDLPDCNENGVLDAFDIASATSGDANGDGVPDECGCPGDTDGSGVVDLSDLAAVLGQFGGTGAGLPGDTDDDGDVDLTDLATVLGSYGETCGS